MTTTDPSGAVSTRATPPVLRRPFLEGQEVVLLGVIAALWLVLSLTTDTFLTSGNFQTVLYTVAPIVIIGVGMTPVMVAAGIDVSVGSQMAVCTAVVGLLVRDAGLGLLVGALVSVGVGMALGAINGALVTRGGIHPMIVTFGTLNIFRFVALQVFGDTQLAGVPNTFAVIGGSSDAALFGVPNALWLALVLAALQWWYMRAFPGGRHIYAIGNDARAARLAGVAVDRTQITLYVSLGALVGLAAIVQLGSGGLVQQNIGVGVEMQVIAACVIGGTSVIGGRGTVLGTVLGALLVGTVTSAITLVGWPSELTNLFVGAFIAVAVGIDIARQNRRARL